MRRSGNSVANSRSAANYKASTRTDLVSEGGLEPPCPFGALAPQASASAYSATRTGDAVHIGWPRVANLAPHSEVNDATISRPLDKTLDKTVGNAARSGVPLARLYRNFGQIGRQGLC